MTARNTDGTRNAGFRPGSGLCGNQLMRDATPIAPTTPHETLSAKLRHAGCQRRRPEVDLEPVVVEAPAPKPIVAIRDLSLTCETVSG